MDMAIGQTQLVTPIQLANLAGALGNGKSVYRPFLMKEVRNSDGMVIAQQSPSVSRALNLDSAIVAILHKSMVEVMAAGGTGGRPTCPTYLWAEKQARRRTRRVKKRMRCSWDARPSIIR